MKQYDVADTTFACLQISTKLNELVICQQETTFTQLEEHSAREIVRGLLSLLPRSRRILGLPSPILLLRLLLLQPAPPSVPLSSPILIRVDFSPLLIAPSLLLLRDHT